VWSQVEEPVSRAPAPAPAPAPGPAAPPVAAPARASTEEDASRAADSDSENDAPLVGEIPPADEGRVRWKPKTLEIPRLARPPTIDGQLGAGEWDGAARIADVTQIQPGNGTPPTEPTEFLIGYDDDNLYVAGRFADSSPELINRSQLVQGQIVLNDDYMQVLLDTYNNKRTGYVFFMNPNGVLRDGLLLGAQQGMGANMDWDGIWQGRAVVGADGWTGEIALPFKTLSFDPRSEVWGFNVVRGVRRRREDVAWSHRDRRVTMDLAGEIRGLRGLQQGTGLDIVPSMALTRRQSFGVTGSGASAATAGGSTNIGKPSLDAFYRITPALTAALTLNTDFSATDVDDRQVNLTRFSLFFPEKRDFFLEGSEAFEFGGLTQNGRPFFSRTIGLSATGQPIDLDVGAKLTGQIGRFTVGTLAVRQEASGSVSERDLFVGRGYWAFGEQSTVGFIATQGDATSERDNTLVGVDLNLRNRTLFDGNAAVGRLWAQQTDTPGLDGDDRAWGAQVDYPNDRLNAALGYTVIGEDFRPALGFVNRVGIRQLDARADLKQRFATGSRLRSWTGGIELQQVEDADGRLETRRTMLTPFTLDNQPGDQITLELIRTLEELRQPFPLPGRLTVATGRYEFDRARVYGQTSGSRSVSLTADFEVGDFFDGDRVDTKLGVQWRPSPHFSLATQYQTNDVDLAGDGRDFTARIYSLTANVAFNVEWAWLNVAQYDNVSRRLGVNSRLRWLPAAGQAAYLVVNYDWREDPFGRLQPFVAETTLKFNYTFRF
jgi:hypothetical protein